MSYCTPCPPCDTNFPLLCEPLETTANGKRLVVEDSAACQKTIQTPVAQQVLKTDGAGNLTWTNGANSTILGKDSTGKVEFATLNSVLQSGPVDLGSQPLTTTGAVTAKTVAITNPSATTALTINQSLAGNGVEINSVDGIPLSIQSTNTNPVKGGTLQFFTASGDMEFNGASDGVFTFYNNSTAATKAIAFSGANVGIGTLAPTEKLDVVGNIKASGSGNFQSIEVGNDAPGVAFIDIKSPTLDDYDLRLTTDGTNGIIKSFGKIYLQPAPSKSIVITNISTYANNTAALAGGLTIDDVYKTVTGELRIVV